MSVKLVYEQYVTIKYLEIIWHSISFEAMVFGKMDFQLRQGELINNAFNPKS